MFEFEFFEIIEGAKAPLAPNPPPGSAVPAVYTQGNKNFECSQIDENSVLWWLTVL